MDKHSQKIDVLKRPIEVGDLVAYTTGGGHRSAVQNIGRVIRWSAKQVQVSRINVKTGQQEESVRSVDVAKLVVVTDQYQSNKERYPENFI